MMIVMDYWMYDDDDDDDDVDEGVVQRFITGDGCMIDALIGSRAGQIHVPARPLKHMASIHSPRLAQWLAKAKVRVIMQSCYHSLLQYSVLNN